MTSLCMHSYHELNVALKDVFLWLSATVKAGHACFLVFTRDEKYVILSSAFS